jgi:sulfocyanin
MLHCRAILATLVALILGGGVSPASAQSAASAPASAGKPSGAAKKTAAKRASAKRSTKAAAAGASTSGAAANAAAKSANEVKVNEFMSYDPTTKTVKLEIDAGLDSKPAPKMGPFNFNGGSLGDQTIIVPTGWTVTYHFVNHDAVPHSFIVIADAKPLPNAPETPAIPRAYSDRLTEGLFTNATSDGSFKATKAGHYLLYCGVPGHGPSGMYINFVVSDEAKVPSYKK